MLDILEKRGITEDFLMEWMQHVSDDHQAASVKAGFKHMEVLREKVFDT
jgi:hypothetical protein